MKKICLILCVSIALMTLISASVWEGAAAVSSGGDLPETGLYMATNSFPVNTMVDVTNLENGKTIRVIASKGLDAPGLLAMLSREAAAAIGLPGRTLGRIRMSQPSDTVTFSRLNEGRAASGDPNFDPAAFTALNGYKPTEGTGKKDETENILNRRVEGGDLIVDLSPDTGNSGASAAPVTGSPPDTATDESKTAMTPGGPEISEPGITGPDYELSLVPSGARPPETGLVPDAAYVIPGITPKTDSQSACTDSNPPIDSGTVPVAEQPPEVSPAVNPVFSAPIISSLEKGKYYLQLAAYSKEETVRSEISKIDSGLPVAIMNAGNTEKPVYRILIGPVNLGESGALLQRFRTNYKDVFVRLGN